MLIRILQRPALEDVWSWNVRCTRRVIWRRGRDFNTGTRWIGQSVVSILRLGVNLSLEERLFTSSSAYKVGLGNFNIQTVPAARLPGVQGQGVEVHFLKRQSGNFRRVL